MLLQRGRLTLVVALTAAGAGGARAAPVLPGPDPVLFSHPYYRCKTNFYVSTTGNDGNAGTSAAPWASLQHANDTIAAAGAESGAGTCVNVLPGQYPAGVHITAGGNAAVASGYLVYRCTKLDACTITGPTEGGAQGGQFAWTQANGPGSYVFVDGFVLQAATPGPGGIYGTGLFGQGIQLWDGDDTVANSPFSVHHVWIINNIISGYGQAGININDGEYFYALHNTVYKNANTGCVAQGSGMGFVELKAIPGNYRRTPDDAENAILGHVGSFNNVIGWNVVYDNATTACGTASDPYDTDGNNIILDTLNNGVIGGDVVTGPSYPGSVLVDFNIVYNAGGRGIHLFRSENITVANNSCYNNNLDPYDDGAYRPCIGDNIGYNNSFFNNLAYGIPRPDLGVPNCAGTGQGCLGFNGAYAGGLATGGGVPDRFYNNIAYCTSTNQPFGYGCNPMFSNSAVRVGGGFYTAAHSGDAVTVAGALPGPLDAQTTYYAVKVGGDQIQFAASAADATANPPSILGFYNIPAGTIAITDKANSRVAPAATVQTDSFPVTGPRPNFVQTDPGWVDVGAQSQGTETTPPVGANFALSPGSPAIGHGLRAYYLSAQSKDLGACPSAVRQCPAVSAQPAK